jgi:hypothetical protein
LTFTRTDFNEDHAFSGYTLEGKLYDSNNNLLQTFDAIQYAENGTTLSLPNIHNGISYRLDVTPKIVYPSSTPRIEGLEMNAGGTNVNLSVSGVFPGQKISAYSSTNLMNGFNTNASMTNVVPGAYNGTPVSTVISNVPVPMIMPEGSAESRPAPAAFFRVKVERDE